MKYYRFRATSISLSGLLFLCLGYVNLKNGRPAEGMMSLAAGVILMTFFSALVVSQRIDKAANKQNIEKRSEEE